MVEKIIQDCLADQFPHDLALVELYGQWLEYKKADKEFCLGCSLPEYQVLAALVRAVQPNCILEIGPGRGASSAAMLSGWCTAGIQQVNIQDGHYGTTLVPEAQRGNIHSFTGTSAAFFEQNQQHFNFAFIDGDHMDPTVSNDIAGCLKWRAPGAVIVAHDIFHKDLEHIGIAMKRQGEAAGLQYAAIQTGANGLGVIY